MSEHTYDDWMIPEGMSYPDAVALFARFDSVSLWRSCIGVGITPTAIRTINPDAEVFIHTPLTFIDKPSGLASYPLSVEEIDAYDYGDGAWLRGADDTIVGGDGIRYVKPIAVEDYVTPLIAFLSENGFDGVIFDGWFDTLYQLPQWFPAEAPTFFSVHGNNSQYGTNEAWWAAWYPFIEGVCTAVQAAGYKVIGNSNGIYNSGSAHLDLQRSLCDGTIYEQLVLGWPPQGDWAGIDGVEARLDSLALDPLEAWVLDYGLRYTTIDQYAKKLQASLAGYYVSLPEDAGLRAKRRFGIPTDSTLAWNSLFDFDTGEPLGAMQKLSFDDGSIYYTREFANCSVEFSYDPALDPKYSGLILLTRESMASMSIEVRREFTVAYATQSTLNSWLPASQAVTDTVEANRLLERATELIDYVTLDSIDPTIIAHAEAAEKATCAQVEYWLGPAGEDVEFQGKIRSVMRSKALTVYAGNGNPDLAPRAYRILLRAGLLHKGAGLKPAHPAGGVNLA